MSELNSKSWIRDERLEMKVCMLIYCLNSRTPTLLKRIISNKLNIFYHASSNFR